VLEDLNSTNGVFLLSKRVKHHVLRDGDVVQLGEHKLVYHDLRRSALEDEFDTDATGSRFPREFDEDFDEDNEEDEEEIEELEVDERSVRAE
jgi:pSer/pThr/pTyr-binding forkhead associated (FHA) protein